MALLLLNCSLNQRSPRRRRRSRKIVHRCLIVLITGYSLLRAPPREWIFACTDVCTPTSRAVVLRLWGDLTCMLRICLCLREAIERERRGVGNVSFTWWRKPERTTSQPPASPTFNQLSYLGPQYEAAPMEDKSKKTMANTRGRDSSYGWASDRQYANQGSFICLLFVLITGYSLL